MIRVAEHVARTDTGRQRATNEDSHLERTPVFVVADGMGGAQAGEVASKVAVAHFTEDFASEDGHDAADRLLRAAHDANAEIHALSEADTRRAGMGTTLTAAYVGGDEVFVAHVGDSRAYRWRHGELTRITEDHSLVEELRRQGRLTEEEAEEHPQRSIITRALGPEPEVDVDTFTVEAADGDLFLLCSDGLTSMVAEPAIAEILERSPDIATAADELIAAALAAGGRDNITVVLFRVESVGSLAVNAPTEELGVVREELAEPPPTGELASPLAAATAPDQLPAPRSWRARTPRARRRAPRAARPSAPQRPRRWRRRSGVLVAILVVLAVLATGGLLASQAVYFIGTDATGQVAIYNGLPYTLPGGVRLYSTYFVSGITVKELSPLEQRRLFNNQLRSPSSAKSLVSQLELGRIAGQ